LRILRFWCAIAVLALLSALHAALAAAQTAAKPTPEVAALIDKGNAAVGAFKFEDAVGIYVEALEKARALKDTLGEAIALSNLGGAYPQTGQGRKAVDSLEKAIPLYRQLGNNAGEASSLWKLSSAYIEIGSLDKALECCEAAQSIFKKIGGRRGEALVLMDMASIYAILGQPRRALEYLDMALPIFREVGGKRGEGMSLKGMATQYREMGQPKKALDFYFQALPIFKGLGAKRAEAATLAYIGLDYGDLGQPGKSLEYFDQALAIQRSNGDRGGEVLTLSGLGTAYVNLRRPDEALASFHRANIICKESGDRANQAQILADIGDLQARRGKTQAAETAYREAIALNETIRASLGGLTEAKSSFLSARVDGHYSYLKLLIRRNDVAAAFALVQKTKARSLLDLLAAGRVDLNAVLTPEERAQELDLRRQADDQNAAMVRQGVENEVGSKKRYEKLKVELTTVERKLQTLTDRLYARHPGLAQKRVARTATMADIARSLPEDTALLDYSVVAKNDIRLFAVSKHSGKPVVSVFKVSASDAELAADGSRFRASCADPRKPFLSDARKLYKALIKPVVGVLKGKKRLIICPDGALWDVPFAALASGSSFLGNRFELAYAYSATGANASLVLASRHTNTPKGSILICANPEFGSSARFGDLKDLPGQRPLDSASRPIDAASRPIDSASRPIDLASRAFDATCRDTGGFARGTSIRALPGTQREADALRKLFPGALVLTGEKAQEGAVKMEAGKFRYLHFATHGFVNDGSPLLSSVVLAKSRPDSKEDGFLTAREIYGMNLNADMTVLSACNTARGENRTGEGVIGLTWALFVAGCPTQVVSQWAVDDASTALLMGRFYENLTLRKMGKAQALKDAEGWLRAQNPKYRHPYYWAPFVVNGAWD
jgi:CHAT domain-containing protein/tetratricopeptide (TPR) repeat protein